MSKRWPSKTIIGLTGNIATGKSAIMRYAAEHGALAIDADKIAHDVLNDEGIQQKIGEVFGDEVRLPDGRVDRATLGKIVFANPEKLAQLENLIHPIVRPRIQQIVDVAPHSIVMIEAIKLLEGELSTFCDQIWVTNCGKFTQMQRLVIARGMDEEQAFERIAAQSPQTEKVAKADIVIDTTGTLAETLRQVAAIWPTAAESEPEAEAPAPPAAEVVAEVVVETPPPTPEPIAPPAEPEPTPAPAAEVASTPVEEVAEAEVEDEIVVRRARPSDIPSIMLLIHRATNGRVKPKRAEILMSLSERGYLIGQVGSEISTVVGWYTDKGFASIEQIYIHPAEAALTTGAAVLKEIGKTANELMCEAVFVFLPQEDINEHVTAALDALQYEGVEDINTWPRVWKQALEEEQPAGTIAKVRKLWTARVA